MNLLQRSIQYFLAPGTPDPALPWMTFGGHQYPIGWGLNQTLGKKQEEIVGNFTGLVQQAYQSSGIVFAIEMARLLLFVQARFQFRRMQSGRPGDYFGTPELAILEKPWRGATTGDLLGRMLLSSDFSGIGTDRSESCDRTGSP